MLENPRYSLREEYIKLKNGFIDQTTACCEFIHVNFSLKERLEQMDVKMLIDLFNKDCNEVQKLIEEKEDLLDMLSSVPQSS